MNNAASATGVGASAATASTTAPGDAILHMPKVSPDPRSASRAPHRVPHDPRK
jgi:hypothetical protein